jgi:hypothetical protein
VPWLPNFKPSPKFDTVQESLVVACLINHGTRSWNETMLKELFTNDSV